MVVFDPREGRAGYSAVTSIQRYDGAVLSDNVIHMAAPGESLPGRLAKFLYMGHEQIRKPFTIVRRQAVPDATEEGGLIFLSIDSRTSQETKTQRFVTQPLVEVDQEPVPGDFGDLLVELFVQTGVRLLRRIH